MRGDVVLDPAGTEVTLVDIGSRVLLDNECVRVWDVSLAPGGVHGWHLHHNPYVVVSVHGSDARMDWLDGSEPRLLFEYRGGAVYRPVSPVHRLTNIGGRFYQNRLIELKDLGEHRSSPLDIGAGSRSIQGEEPGGPLTDGRRPVIAHPHVSVWTIEVASGSEVDLALGDVPHVVVALDDVDDAAGGVRYHPGGDLTLAWHGVAPATFSLVELTYLDDLSHLVEERS